MRTMPPVRLAVSLLDQTAAGVDVGHDQDDQDGQYGDRQQDQDSRGSPFQQAPGQKACPMPI